MDEPSAIELLPWYLNGSLEGEERTRVEEWLERSAVVRGELREVRRALEIFDLELPIDALLDTASRVDGSEWPADVVERAASVSPATGRDLRAAREGFDAVHAVPSSAASSPRPAAGAWRHLALAATLVAAVSVVGWAWTWSRASEPALDSVRVNLPTHDLFPEGLVLRGADGGSTSPSETGGLVLFLHSGLPADRAIDSLTLRDPAGEEVWRVRGPFERGAVGELALQLPVSRLSPGDYVIELSVAAAPAEVAERFPFRVRERSSS